MRLVLAALLAVAASPALAEDFVTYRCADGTVMPVVFHRNVANVQIDGKALRLPHRLLSVTGSRYEAAGVTLSIGRDKVWLRRKGERRVACTAE